MHGRLEDKIIQKNLDAGNELVLSELTAAYSNLYQRFSDTEVVFYTSNSEEEIENVTDLMPSIRQFVAKNSQLDKRSLEFLVKYAEFMRRQNLPYIFSTSHFYQYLDINPTKLTRLESDLNSHYRTKEIPKRHGGFRRIDAPSSELKFIQSKINQKVLKYARLNRAAMGFRVGKSIKDNATIHRNKYAVLSLDLEDFFHSIPSSRVFAALSNLGFTKSVAQKMTSLCCYRQSLPMGAPTSPVLANLVASRMDRRLAALAKKEGFSYSRYADDITVSFKGKESLNVIPLIKQIIGEEGFRINPKKESLHFQHQRQYVTGIVVNEGLNIKRSQYKKLRAVLYNARVGDIQQEMKKWGAEDLLSFKAQLEGHIHFISMINSKKANKLKNEFATINWYV